MSNNHTGRIITIVLSLLMVACLSLFAASVVNAVEPLKTITMTIEEWTQIEKMFQEQQTSLANEKQEKMYWFDQWQGLKQCIRDSAKEGLPVTVCIGDKAS